MTDLFRNPRFISQVLRSTSRITELKAMRRIGLVVLACTLTSLVPFQAAGGAGRELTIGPNGTESVDRRTPFKIALIRSLFPTYTVTEGTESWEGDPYPVIYVNDGNERLLTITGADEGVVRRVWTESSKVRSSFGIMVGMTYRQIFRESPIKKCSTGSEDATGTIFCAAPQSELVTYQFAGKVTGADLPSARILGTWKVHRIIWSNPDVD